LEKEEWKVCSLYNAISSIKQTSLTMKHLNTQKTSPTLCWLLFPLMGLVLVPPHGKNQIWISTRVAGIWENRLSGSQLCSTVAVL